MSAAEQLELFGRVLLALLLGALIGFEREFRGHEAGIRTNSLVCGASALFGSLSAVYGDDRLAAAVVQGIGFLGAGIVLHRHGAVRGVTTAATVWMTAALGLAVAGSLYLLASLATVVVVVLLELSPVTDRLLAARLGRATHPSQPVRSRSAGPESSGDGSESPPLS